MDGKVLESPPVPSEIFEGNELIHQRIVKQCEKHLDSVFMVIPRNNPMIDAASGNELRIDSVLYQSKILAAKLQVLGCRPGHVIGIICENRCEYFIIILAILATGATVACFNPTYSIGELEHTLSITNPFILFVNFQILKQLQKINQSCRSYKFVINLDSSTTVSSSLSYTDIIQSSEKLELKIPTLSFDYSAFILFSSGSTGLPKGVMLSSRSLVFLINYINYIHTEFGSPKEIILSVIPLFHGYGLLILLRAACSGHTIINMKKFDERLFLSSIERYKVTSVSAVPALMNFLAKNTSVDKFDLSSLQHITCGAAPLSDSLEIAVKKRLQVPKIIKGYGMTETTIICTSTFLSEEKPGTVGRLLFGMKAKVVEPITGTALGPNKEGEICLKGCLVMKGYYRNEEETKKMIDENGWLHTGDIGYYDNDGDFFIVDRIKDLIKYKGYQVAPAELESLLIQHEAIADAAVIGIPDESAGEVPKAFLVKRANISEQEILDYVAGKVAPHMKIRGGITFVNEIPRNTNGKILRRLLRAQVRAKL